MSGDLVKELRDGLVGTTPGPWYFYSAPLRAGMSIVIEVQCDDQRNPVVQWSGFDNSNRSMAKHKKNARHIARCSPENIAALLDHIEALKAVLTKAKLFHDRDSGCNGFTADYEILRLEIDEALR